MTDTPTNLSQALASFSDIYSPRIVGRVNDYDIRVAHARGEHVWHVHDHTDEFFLVIDGQFDIALREGDGERTVSLRSGDIFVVPQGVEHKPSSPGGSILMFEPSGTLTTGDRHQGGHPRSRRQHHRPGDRLDGNCLRSQTGRSTSPPPAASRNALRRSWWCSARTWPTMPHGRSWRR